MYSELALTYAISYPVESHVHGFCTFGLDCVIGYSGGDSVVCLYGRLYGRWAHLGVSRFG